MIAKGRSGSHTWREEEEEEEEEIEHTEGYKLGLIELAKSLD